MMKKLTTVSLTLILLFTLSTVAFAQDEVPACTGEQVSGTVVAYDAETKTATIDTGEGFCTITLNDEEQDYGHPITTLLGNYFNNYNEDDLNFEESLTATEVCLNLVEGTTDQYELYTPAEGEECPFPAVVSSENEDGSFQVVIGEGETAEEVSLSVDEETANGLSEALNGLVVDLNLNEDGSLQDAGDVIGELHDNGVGFGVIVKLFGIAQSTGMSVDDLIAEYQAGASMGELFQKYGKPALVGVGHVRKDAANSTNDTPDDGTEEGVVGEGTSADGTTDSPTNNGNSGKPPKDKDKNNQGICNAIEHGGKPKANGQGEVDCGDGD